MRPAARTTPRTSPRPVRVPPAATLTLAVASVTSLAAFGWPFLLRRTEVLEAGSHGTDAPWLFALLLPLLAAMVLAELNAGGLDAKAVALLGLLSAVGGALRALSPGVAGLEPSFAVIILGGRVFGRGFGFVLGALSMFVGALLTGGVGPWLPFQMMAAGWVGLAAGCLPRRLTGRSEVAVLAGLGLVLGLLFGAVMNLWFWPFAHYGAPLSYDPTAGLGTNLVHYGRYYLATSLVWDLGRGGFTAALLGACGTPLLRALRRVSRLAAFEAPVRFEP